MLNFPKKISKRLSRSIKKKPSKRSNRSSLEVMKSSLKMSFKSLSWRNSAWIKPRNWNPNRRWEKQPTPFNTHTGSLAHRLNAWRTTKSLRPTLRSHLIKNRMKSLRDMLAKTMIELEIAFWGTLRILIQRSKSSRRRYRRRLMNSKQEQASNRHFQETKHRPRWMKSKINSTKRRMSLKRNICQS